MSKSSAVQQPFLMLVEDDVELAKMTVSFLEDEGFRVERVENGAEAVVEIVSKNPDLVVLDIMLPGMDGMEVCRAVQDSFPNPILMLTARDDDLAEIMSLNRGADGYLTKPVRAHVLLAHINALLRRRDSRAKMPSLKALSVQDLTIKKDAQEVNQGEGVVKLTSGEYELLLLLAEHAGTAVSRDELCLSLRGFEYDGADRAIDMRISALREKLDDSRPPYQYIKTVRGKGYMLAR